MNLTQILEALAELPTLAEDAAMVAAQFKSAPDTAAKVDDVLAGIDHLVTQVAPLLK